MLHRSAAVCVALKSSLKCPATQQPETYRLSSRILVVVLAAKFKCRHGRHVADTPRKNSMKRTILLAATVLVATVAQAADNGFPADFDTAKLVAYGQATGQIPSVPRAKQGDPKLEDLTAGAAPTHATVLDSCREWVAQSNTDQGRLVEMGYATGFMNAVEVYGPKIRTATIGEIADSFTRVCREHPEVPPQLAALGVITEFQVNKPTR